MYVYVCICHRHGMWGFGMDDGSFDLVEASNSNLDPAVGWFFSQIDLEQ